MVADLWLCRNSMGSSMVMMWQVCCSLILSSRVARVDDLPDPRAPVTSTMPSRRLAISPNCGGRPKEAKLGRVVGMMRITTAQLPRGIKTLTRKRANPGRPNEISHDHGYRRLVITVVLIHL